MDMPRPRALPAEADIRLQVELRRLNLHLAELINKVMEREGVSRAELARRLGVSRSHVTQMLAGDRNLNLRSVVEALYRLEARLHAEARPLVGDESAPRSVDWDSGLATRDEADLMLRWRRRVVSAFDDRKTSEARHSVEAGATLSA